MAEITAALTLDAGPAKATTDQFGASAMKAAQAVDGLSASQRELIARSEKVAAVANTIDIQNKKAVSSYLQQVAQVRALAAQIGVLDQVQQHTAQAAQEVTQHVAAEAAAMRALRAETGLAAASHEGLGAMAGLTGGRINSLRSSVTSLAASFLGAAPGVAQFTGMLGTMALGSGVMIGVMAGMAAIGFAWDLISSKAKESAERHKEALASIRDEIAKTKRAMEDLAVVEAQHDVDAARRGLNAARETHTVTTATGTIVTAGSSGKADQQALAEAQSVLEAAIQRRNAVQSEASRTGNERYNSDLATLIRFNQATALERQNALARLKAYEKEAADLQKSGADNTRRVFAVNEANKLRDALFPKTSGGGDVAKESREIAAAMREAERAIDAFNKARAEQSALANASIASAKIDVETTQRLITAYREGPEAVRALTDQLEIEAATRDFLAKTKDVDAAQREADLAALQAEIRARQQLSHVLAGEKEARDQTSQAQKRADDEAQRNEERAARELQRATASAIEQGVTDFLHGANPFAAFEHTMEAAVVRAFSAAIVSKILASKVVESIKGMFNTGESNGAHGGFADASVSMAEAEFYKKLGKGAGAAIGGYAIGNGIGQATGSGVAGAIGGAASGFMLGNAILPGIGGAVGGIAGFIGGIIGAGDAARAAAEQMRKAKEAFDNAFDSAKALVAHDDLGQQIAAAHQYFDQLRQGLKDGSTWVQQFVGENLKLGTYAEKLAEINRLEQQRIDQLTEEAAALRQYFSEDLQVEQERARADIAESQGNAAEAKRLRDDADKRAYFESQERRLDEYRRTHDMTDPANQQQYAELQYTVALNEQAFVIKQNTAAVNALTSTMLHNAPTGFKYQQYAYEFGTPRAPTFTPPAPNFPQTPLSGGTTLSRSSGAQITIAPVFQIDGTKTTRAQVKDIATELKRIVVETLGSNADVSEGWGLLA